MACMRNDTSNSSFTSCLEIWQAILRLSRSGLGAVIQVVMIFKWCTGLSLGRIVNIVPTMSSMALLTTS